MKKFCKAIYAALLDKLATILITVVIGGGMAACNHSKIADTNKWVGEHLADKQEQITKLQTEAADQAEWQRFQIYDQTNK